MDNYEIADNFSLLGKLMDIHGDNSFKAKSYTSAAFTIEKLPMQLADMAPEKINSINGIGEAIGKRIKFAQVLYGRIWWLFRFSLGRYLTIFINAIN